MIDDVSDIAAFYNNDPEREHSRLDLHQLESDLTWRYLNHYLPSQGSILEVGAATGKYTLELARRGYALTAEGLEGRVQFVVADARTLGEIPKESFDAVLLMGPLYHLIVETDRKMALKVSYDRLREGSIIFSSFISRFGVLSDLLKNVPNWIEDQLEAQSLLERGKRPDHYPRGGFRGYIAHPSEIAPLHEEIGFDTLVMAGVEPVISADDESYNKLQGKQRQQWLDLLYAISTEQSILGASRHLLYIGQKIGGKHVKKG
jgi:SAM-dependent methyltransferase